MKAIGQIRPASRLDGSGNRSSSQRDHRPSFALVAWSIAPLLIALSGCRLDDLVSGPAGASLPPINRLAYVQQPGAAVAGAPFPTPVTVTVQDENGNPVASFTGAISVSLGINPGGATLSGTTTVNASGGTATFSDLSVDKPGVGYALTTGA